MCNFCLRDRTPRSPHPSRRATSASHNVPSSLSSSGVQRRLKPAGILDSVRLLWTALSVRLSFRATSGSDMVPSKAISCGVQGSPTGLLRTICIPLLRRFKATAPVVRLSFQAIIGSGPVPRRATSSALQGRRRRRIHFHPKSLWRDQPSASSLRMTANSAAGTSAACFSLPARLYQ